MVSREYSVEQITRYHGMYCFGTWFDLLLHDNHDGLAPGPRAEVDLVFQRTGLFFLHGCNNVTHDLLELDLGERVSLRSLEGWMARRVECLRGPLYRSGDRQ